MAGLDQYIPERAWFDRQAQRAYAGTHGIGHITRVLVWSEQIAERFKAPLRREELLWAAGLHDIKRWDDGIDPDHGARAAEWVRDEFANVRPDAAGMLDLDLVAALCRDHQRSDHLIEDWTDELRVLKDADGLERVRIHDLDPHRLRLQDISPALEPRARDLMQRSVALGNTADAVRSVAEEMGLWV
ncbi:MAG: HD domain-containing protein [Thermomicrobiales bacterium]|nr:HD domain-containing protein [Thermomicrobiales bacterium]